MDERWPGSAFQIFGATDENNLEVAMEVLRSWNTYWKVEHIGSWTEMEKNFTYEQNCTIRQLNVIQFSWKQLIEPLQTLPRNQLGWVQKRLTSWGFILNSQSRIGSNWHLSSAVSTLAPMVQISILIPCRPHMAVEWRNLFPRFLKISNRLVTLVHKTCRLRPNCRLASISKMVNFSQRARTDQLKPSLKFANLSSDWYNGDSSVGGGGGGQNS